MNRLFSINKLWIISYYKIIIYSHASCGFATSSFKNQNGKRIRKRTGSQFSGLTKVQPMVNPMIS